MWITRQLTANFRQEYTIQTKILDSRSQHTLEIFKSDDFGEVAMIDEKHLLLKKYIFIESEVLAHIPLCSVPQPKNVLLFDSFNLQIAFECFKHNIRVDCMQNDRKTLDSLMSFLPDFHNVLNHDGFRLFSQALDLDIKNYDVIITDSIINKMQIDGLSRMLSEDGILIMRNHHPLLEEGQFIQSIQDCASFFKITLPFFLNLSILSDKSYIFASKRFHPTADMLLQKIDLLPYLEYYNAKIHEGAFVLPSFLARKLQNVAKF